MNSEKRKETNISSSSQSSSSSLVVTIMAAGEGKRMNSGGIPKVLCLFNGLPMLVRIVFEVIELSPAKIIIVTSNKYHDMIVETIGKMQILYNSQNSQNSQNLTLHVLDKIEFVKQGDPRGTANAIYMTLDKYADDDQVLILNGDMPAITSSTLKEFINDSFFFPASLLVAQIDNPFGYGRVVCCKHYHGDEVLYIREEKDCNEEERLVNIINAGIYLFSGEILKKYIPMIDCDNKQNEYYLTDIVKMITMTSSDIEVRKFEINPSKIHEILGVNTQEELKKLEMLV